MRLTTGKSRKACHRRLTKHARTILLLTALSPCVPWDNGNTLFAQTPDWSWAKSAGGPTCSVMGSHMTSDAEGNLFVTGNFMGGPMTLGTITINESPGNVTVFLAKYKKDGTVLWAKSFAQGFDGNGSAVATDAQGNVYVTGSYGSFITFGTTTLNSVGDYDMFVAKFDPSGNVLWAKNAGGAGLDEGSRITVDADGSACVQGDFSGPTVGFGGTTLSNAGEMNAFVAKYSSSGSLVWAKNIAASTGIINASGITTDAAKNIYVMGIFAGSNITIGGTTLTNAGSNDVYVAKYDAGGNPVWAKGIGGSGGEQAGGITTDAGGNIYLAGGFSGSVTLGTTTLNTVGGVGDIDCFVARFSNTGSVVWAKSAGSGGSDFGADIVADKQGNINMTGSMLQAITFGTITVPSSGQLDAFIVRYDANGTALWAKGAGGTDFDSGSGIAADASGNVYATGSFSSPSIVFGGTTLSNTTGTGSSIYLAKYASGVTTGIADHKNADAFRIYPNPSRGLIKIHSSNIINDIYITNVLGQVVYRDQISLKGDRTVELQGQPGGIYWVHVQTDNGNAVEKVLIEQ